MPETRNRLKRSVGYKRKIDLLLGTDGFILGMPKSLQVFKLAIMTLLWKMTIVGTKKIHTYFSELIFVSGWRSTHCWRWSSCCLQRPGNVTSNITTSATEKAKLVSGASTWFGGRLDRHRNTMFNGNGRTCTQVNILSTWQLGFLFYKTDPCFQFTKLY